MKLSQVLQSVWFSSYDFQHYIGTRKSWKWNSQVGCEGIIWFFFSTIVRMFYWSLMPCEYQSHFYWFLWMFLPPVPYFLSKCFTYPHYGLFPSSIPKALVSLFFSGHLNPNVSTVMFHPSCRYAFLKRLSYSVAHL